jgi:ribosomal protein L16 Arg81 hydroxylase
MPALSQWLDPLSVSEFVATYLGREPFARASCAASATECCSWDSLDRLLQAEPPDVLVVAKSKLLDVPPPRSLSALRSLFQKGIGVAIRAPERTSPEFEVLAREFQRDLPGDQRLIVFATPARTHGFGWHYDAEDVFVVQTAGDKAYYLRDNTVSTPPERGFQSDFSQYRDETSPLLCCRLLSGDLLYVPKGEWHMAIAQEDSLSLSIGVFPEIAEMSRVQRGRSRRLRPA